MHHFHSNSSVTFNAVTQETGILIGEVFSATLGNLYEGVTIDATFLKEGENPVAVHSVQYRVTEEEMNAFEATITLSETGSFGRFQEICTRYVLSKIDGMWGLTTSDWTIEEHDH